MTEIRDAFVHRHIADDASDVSQMLERLNVDSLEALVSEVVPDQIRLTVPLNLPAPLDEASVTADLQRLASRNNVRHSMRGRGYYGTITPPVVKRNVLESPSWYTSYTPYQPEISQGRLEGLLNYQTLVSELTGLPIANASLLDESTACAEAMTMAHRISKSKSNTFVVDADIHPQTLSVLATRAEPIGITLHVCNPLVDELPDAFGVLVCQPGSSGMVKDPTTLLSLASSVHGRDALFVLDVDPLYSVIGASAASVGADIAVGSMQRFGVPMGFGGPHAAFMATTDAHARSMPGRIVGVSVDSYGRPAYRLALQTREQHIRREKATSNICTAQALLANIAGFYAAWHGADGLRRIAFGVHQLTSNLAASLVSGGNKIANTKWFDTLTVVDCDAFDIQSRLKSAGYELTVVDDDTVSLSLDETFTQADVDAIDRCFGTTPLAGVSPLSEADLRHDEILQQPVFTSYRTEHEMLRYLRRLSDKDLALDRTMIPLGSCTMKLNATTQMEPITWPGFANLHPHADLEDRRGYTELVSDLENWLCAITGYDAVSLQPNAGSQGEFAGLLAIRAYHRSRGDLDRNVCLIPSSAHGTNAASAVMCGMKVVVVSCDSQGNVDVDDLREKTTQAAGTLAALMITYPSTHGVFESRIKEICALVHDAGGQVYLDGANLNAMVGLAQPGKFGADVSHLNLHKTFCIPHGGGGPGVGPVAVRSHLAAFLPSTEPTNHSGVGMVSAAPFGSAGILPIAWAYVRLMGAEGLTRASMHAILNANYLAARIGEVFPILYTGANGRVAHECIVDIRGITKDTGVTVDDIAKRLMDHAFHAPTMSFPVAGTLMIEPTESESLSELHRFVDAMRSIATEIDAVASGAMRIEDSPLRNAPHTVRDMSVEWTRSYSREQALAVNPDLKSYFPPVNRIDSAHGDRNLVCTCAPIEAYATANRDAERTATV